MASRLETMGHYGIVGHPKHEAPSAGKKNMVAVAAFLLKSGACSAHTFQRLNPCPTPSMCTTITYHTQRTSYESSSPLGGNKCVPPSCVTDVVCNHQRENSSCKTIVPEKRARTKVNSVIKVNANVIFQNVKVYDTAASENRVLVTIEALQGTKGALVGPGSYTSIVTCFVHCCFFLPSLSMSCGCPTNCENHMPSLTKG